LKINNKKLRLYSEIYILNPYVIN